ncbi:MAG: hypothetical protein AAF696_02115 [Bacteroidota bacterium]
MKKLLLSVLLSLIFLSLQSQSPQNIADKALHFQLNKDADSIDFTLIDTSLSQKKPVFLFCQGSLPLPLFVEVMNAFVDWTLYPANPKE